MLYSVSRSQPRLNSALCPVHRYMSWLARDQQQNFRSVGLNEYFGLCFLFLTNPFATLISTIPWWVTKLSTNDITYLLQGNRGCRRTATATPNRDCGCSRGLQQLFDGDCYGDGPNHLIFVTRIKSGRSPKATITGQCMPVNNAVGAAPPLSSPVVPACSNLMKKIIKFQLVRKEMFLIIQRIAPIFVNQSRII
ncbi:hypothetical protein NC652_029129 [Populus alba x Populus x berolinensis]|nr:hypothetical protein NC652_029129 [Populus alba x Populus x berolinensis]